MGLRACPIPDLATQHIRAQLGVLMDEAGGDVAALLALIGQDPEEWVEVEARGEGRVGEMANISPAVIDVLEAAGVLGVSRDVIYDAVKKGELRGIRVCGRVLIPKVEINRVLEYAHYDGYPVPPATPTSTPTKTAPSLAHVPDCGEQGR